MGTLLLEEPASESGVWARPSSEESVDATAESVAAGEGPVVDSSRPAKLSTKELLRTSFRREPITLARMQWPTLGWMVLMHAGCLVAPFFFSWSALGITALLYWMTGCIGITFCYHRYLSHRSFKLAKPVEFIAQLCGVWALQGGPLTWSATHRIHHARSDKEGDPHSPREGKRWSHMLWLFVDRSNARDPEFQKKIVPDLLDDGISRFFEKTFFLWTVLLSVGLFAVGGWSWLLWGLCVRMVLTYHSTWFVNSATHLWGYRTYETTDDSKNLWWVALLTHGEGWHNNHHAYPRIARAGHKWWELDPTYGIILILKGLGLAWDVNDELPDLNRRSSPPAVSAH